MADVSTALTELVSKFKGFIEDFSELSVATFFVAPFVDPATTPAPQSIPKGLVIDDAGNIKITEQANVHLLACLVMKLDGDTQMVLPMKKDPATGELIVDEVALAIHNQNVSTAIAYRTGIISAIGGLVRGAVEKI